VHCWIVVGWRWASSLLVGSWSGESRASDPGLPDPTRPVTREEYTFGDQAFVPSVFVGTGAAVELTASVHSPTELTGGPVPLVIFLHGNNWTCGVGGLGLVEGVAVTPWPCNSPSEITPNYAGYELHRRGARQPRLHRGFHQCQRSSSQCF
jgi:hypothetical protein